MTRLKALLAAGLLITTLAGCVGYVPPSPYYNSYTSTIKGPGRGETRIHTTVIGNYSTTRIRSYRR